MKSVFTILILALLVFPGMLMALDGIVKNSITDEGIPDAVVRLYADDVLVDSTRSDENGYYNVSPNSVTLPKNNINISENYNIKIFDINGRHLYTLDENWNGTTIPNLPSGPYIFATPYNAVVNPVMEGELLNPIKPLTERVLTGKNTSKTSGADDVMYTLKVTDDDIEGEIDEYYDASIDLEGDRGEIQSLERDIELIPFYKMQDWDGDFLEYLTGTQSRGVQIWGDYPNNYPVNVDLDSVNCVRYCEDRTETYLESIRNALDLWNERTGLDIFNYESVDENNRQIRVNYSREQGSQFDPDYIQDRDGRWRIESGIVYLRNRINSPDLIQRLAEHEVGHATGWVHHSHEGSVMCGRYEVHITEDDGYTARTFTSLRNNTFWYWYSPENPE